MDPSKRSVDRNPSPTGVLKPKPQKESTNKTETDKPKERKAEKSPSTAKEKKIIWLTRAMAEEVSREAVLYTTFREALLYIIFVVAVTMCTMGRRSVLFFHITEALKNQFVEKDFVTVNDKEIDFENIKSVTDFWFYAETLLLESFYWEHYYDSYNPIKPAKEDDKKILFENKLLGVPRIRQVKVRNDSCIVHNYFRRLFLSCYDLYGKDNEDHEPFGPENSTAWSYSPPSVTNSLSYTGEVSTYDGGGFYQDFATTKEESYKMLRSLKDNLWITRGTRAVFVDFSVYNANLNLFVVCKLIFELPPTGGVVTSRSFKAVHLLRYLVTWDYYTFAAECIVYAIALFFIIEELREIVYFKWRYFLQFWTYIDWTIIAMALANLLTSAIIFPKTDAAINKIIQNPDQYGNLEYLAEKKVLYNTFAACLLFFSYIKIFKYISFNKTMGQLNNTLKNCALDIVGFSLMFFIIFFAFAELGYLLFGSQVDDFSSFGVSMFSLLRTILGDFEYGEIERANRILAPIYFLSYIFFVFFVLLNMFLAIINDTYADVKTEIAIAPEEKQMADYLKDSFYNILRKCGFNIKEKKQKAEFNATIQQIRDALKKCGFSDLEIEMFFARYNIDPHDDTGDYDVKKIMKELENQSTERGKLADDTSLVHIRDFITQQERLHQIEQIVDMLAQRIDTLIRKLEAFENLRKQRANQG